jgi:hypothetical protein
VKSEQSSGNPQREQGTGGFEGTRYARSVPFTSCFDRSRSRNSCSLGFGETKRFRVGVFLRWTKVGRQVVIRVLKGRYVYALRGTLILKMVVCEKVGRKVGGLDSPSDSESSRFGFRPRRFSALTVSPVKEWEMVEC